MSSDPPNSSPGADVTVLVPTYNHAHVLGYQLQSLLDQTLPPKEIVVFDDGSTDDTQQVLDRFRAHPNVRIITSEKNVGLHAGQALLLDQVKTEFFAFAAADDLLTSDWCMTMASLLRAHPEAKMAVSNTFVFDRNEVRVTDGVPALGGSPEGVYTPREYERLLLRHGRFPPSNTIVYRSDIIEELVRPILMQKELRLLVDVVLILAIASRYAIAYSTRPTGVFVRSAGSYGGAAPDEKSFKDLLAYVEMCSVNGGRALSETFARFFMRYLEYWWSKQAVLAEARETRVRDGIFRACCVRAKCYARLLSLFFSHRRFLHVSASRAGSRADEQRRLRERLDERLFARFDCAC